ncbi:MAG: dihydropteroate synthase [Polyangiales bacterium]
MSSFSPLKLGTTVWDWSRPYVLAVLNVTPDSFSDGGRYRAAEAAIEHGLSLVAAGADALDIGGESTRPDADPVSLEEELARVIPVIEGLSSKAGVPISIDTMKREVARAALSAGATIVNDVGMGDDATALGSVAAEAGAAYIAMHARGTPVTMRALSDYRHVAEEVAEELAARAITLEMAGVHRSKIILDPGIGFAKTPSQSLELLADLGPLRSLGYPLCVGPSRKRFIDAAEAYDGAWGITPSAPAERIGGTAAAVTAAIYEGASMVRVHDVAVMRQAARVAHAIAVRRRSRRV